ncbi:DUF1206 domain-containing protein [Actinomyces haliotis]|uniref:DUF1206 domain-containing protein n=1 Tax=Actinomyces haliotis TaxID=1280843 RepID=UPI0038993F9B
MARGSGGGAGGSADQSGALAELAQAPGGAVVLGLGAVAMVALAVFYPLDAVVGDGARRAGTVRGGTALSAGARSSSRPARGGSSASRSR